MAMPTDMFYNTNITTYLWFMSNRKPVERQGKVMLIDASGMSRLMKKNLGKKRREFTTDCVERIVRAYADFKDMAWKDEASGRVLQARIFDREHFFYRKVTVERPCACVFRRRRSGFVRWQRFWPSPRCRLNRWACSTPPSPRSTPPCPGLMQRPFAPRYRLRPARSWPG
ncbi:MAG: N-6 DNA methylase [Candidatus Accumulibacter sp.]|nr:N-6 DNA methylase [Accumulibacter sp.]